MALDWVPMAFYGTNISVPASSTIYVILYPLPDFGAGDVEFLVEDTEERSLFLERIVGDITPVYSGAGSPAWFGWALMSLGVDYDTPAVLEPFTSVWSIFSSEWANHPIWDRRAFLPPDNATGIQPQPVDHPYWTHVDIKPGRALGAKANLWPVLALQNTSSEDSVRVIHTLRAIYT